MLGIKPKIMVILPDGFIWVSLASMLKKFMRFDTVWANQRQSTISAKWRLQDRKQSFNAQVKLLSSPEEGRRPGGEDVGWNRLLGGIDPSHRRLRPLRYFHDRFDFYRPKRKFPSGIRTR
jgi:hypothetical protein